MKLTSSKIKKIMIVVSIILPFLLYQVGVYYNYNTINKNVLIEETDQELKLIEKRTHQKLEDESMRVATIHKALFINPMDLDTMTSKDSYEDVVYLWSGDENLTEDNYERLQGFLKSRQEGDRYTVDGQYIYIYNVNLLHDSVLAKRLLISEFVDYLLIKDQSQYDFCIYEDETCIYKSDTMETPIALNSENTIQVDGYTVKYHYDINEHLEIMVEKEITEPLNAMRNQTIMYAVLLELLLIGVALLIFRKINQSPSEVEIITKELEILNQSLDHQSLKVEGEHDDIERMTTNVYQKIKRYRSTIEEMMQESQALDKAILETESTYQNYEIIKANHHEVIDQLMTDKKNLVFFMSMFFSMIDQVLIEIDLKGNVKFANHYFYYRFRYEEEEALNLLDIIEFESNLDNVFNHFLMTNEESVFAYLKYHDANQSKRELLRFRKIKWSEDTFLLVAKSIHDEVTLQSLIMRKNREFDYINQINSALISNWGVDDLLKSIIKKVDFLFSANISEIFIKEKDKWVLKESTQRETTDPIEIEDIGAYFNTSVQDGKIKVLDDCESYIKDIGEEAVHHIILAPLEVDNDILAIMIIGVKKNVSTSDINMIKMFKNQASIVVQRSILYDELRDQYFNTIEALVNVIEAKDKYTEGHSRRVSQFSVEIAEKMGYSNEEIEKIEISGLLHDVGKVGIKQEILTKRGKLTDEEYQAIKQHPEKGIQILKAIKFDNEINEGILYHHVRYDLKGYPANHGLTELPEVAAIIGVADAFDAMTSARSYTVAKNIDQALEELIRYKGTQFKADVVDAMSEIVKHNRHRLNSIINDMRG